MGTFWQGQEWNIGHGRRRFNRRRNRRAMLRRITHGGIALASSYLPSRQQEMGYALSILLVLLMMGGTAIGPSVLAHEFWANGAEVDPWTKRVCCGQHDAMNLKPTQIHVTKEGYLLDDTGETIAFDRVQPSPDGLIWAFRWAGETQCFFKPPEST
jgi:hypothetical protein